MADNTPKTVWPKTHYESQNEAVKTTFDPAAFNDLAHKSEPEPEPTAALKAVSRADTQAQIGALYDDGPADQDLLDFIKSRKVDYSKDIGIPPPALTINGETFATLGSFSMVYGAAKSKKTFAITMAIAAAVKGKFGPFEGHLPPEKSKVILIDTEQDVYRVTRQARRIMRMVGAPPDTFHENFDAYYFPGDEPEKIMASISKILEITPNAGIVIIDGLVDLSFDINDPKEAPVVIKTVQRWAVEYNIHIIGVLHQNKGNENMRGHIGTWALNKAESVAHVRRDVNNKDVSSVSPSETRDKAFEPFAFIIKETGLPEIISGWVPANDDKGNKKQSKPRPSNLDPHTNYNILVWLHEHTDGKETTYSKMCDLIKLAVADKTGHQIGDSIVREYLTHYHDVDGVIIKHGTSGTQRAHYTIELPPPPSESGSQKKAPKSNQVEMGISGVNMHDQEPF